MASRDDEGRSGFISRRGFIKVAAVATASIALASCNEERRALGRLGATRRRTPFITPNEDFYLVAIDPKFRPEFGIRTVDEAWSLTIEGPDGRSVELSYADLTGENLVEFPYTFECIGNPLGGSLIGNARWRGVPLARVLRDTGLMTAGVQSVMFYGLDEMYSSVSVERVMDDYSFLASEMNGEPLPAGHGFPVRTILPNLYGMKQPRWLDKIVLQETAETESYWERRGWAGEIPVKIESRIDPVGDVTQGESTTVTGIGFAGSRGVRAVEISLNGGQTWQPCTLVDGGDPHVWATWEYEWREPTEESVNLLARVVDGEGNYQIGQETDRFPDGVTGYDNEMVRVRG